MKNTKPIPMPTSMVGRDESHGDEPDGSVTSSNGLTASFTVPDPDAAHQYWAPERVRDGQSLPLPRADDPEDGPPVLVNNDEPGEANAATGSPPTLVEALAQIVQLLMQA